MTVLTIPNPTAALGRDVLSLTARHAAGARVAAGTLSSLVGREVRPDRRADVRIVHNDYSLFR